MTRGSIIAALLALLATSLTACGLKGPLYLPSEPTKEVSPQPNLTSAPEERKRKQSTATSPSTPPALPPPSEPQPPPPPLEN